ncbi:hypothetical protein BKA70DRAFT_1234948 [Coprinopsis sp. MPI-PUGE-AT-0042]|nr:hypothetical protein BKA70DRAFT_1234948 [Coprinopsis sp. MPI-PUGE-AT-0042]
MVPRAKTSLLLDNAVRPFQRHSVPNPGSFGRARAELVFVVDEEESKARGCHEGQTGDSDDEIGCWDGTVNRNLFSDDDGSEIFGSGDESGDIEELDGEELNLSMDVELERDLEALRMESVFDVLMESSKGLDTKGWDKVQNKQRGGANLGNSKRMQESHEKKARDKAESDTALRKTAGADMMRRFALSGIKKPSQQPEPDGTSSMSGEAVDSPQQVTSSAEITNDIFQGYLSNIELEDDEIRIETKSRCSMQETNLEILPLTLLPESPIPRSWMTSGRIWFTFPRRSLETTLRKMEQDKQAHNCEDAPVTISKLNLLKMPKTFVSGPNGLQASWAQAIESTTSSLLDDPAIAAELLSDLRSHKWALDPAKLAQFTQNKMIPEAAKKYTQNMAHNEMPAGLKKYLEAELFPRIHLKTTKGISLDTARSWLRKEGFVFIHGVQERCCGIPSEGILTCDGKLSKPVVKDRNGERKLVLVAHDEMTAQAHDGKRKFWIPKGEQSLRKKGVGRGVHQSDVITSTVGWLEEASETLEYGKAHGGYWTGELLVKQRHPFWRKLLKMFMNPSTKDTGPTLVQMEAEEAENATSAGYALSFQSPFSSFVSFGPVGEAKDQIVQDPLGSQAQAVCGVKLADADIRLDAVDNFIELTLSGSMRNVKKYIEEAKRELLALEVQRNRRKGILLQIVLMRWAPPALSSTSTGSLATKAPLAANPSTLDNKTEEDGETSVVERKPKYVNPAMYQKDCMLGGNGKTYAPFFLSGKVIGKSAQTAFLCVKSYWFELCFTCSHNVYLADRDIHTYITGGIGGGEVSSALTGLLAAFVSLFNKFNVDSGVSAPPPFHLAFTSAGGKCPVQFSQTKYLSSAVLRWAQGKDTSKPPL